MIYIISSVLLAADKAMPEMHVMQLVFTSSTSGTFIENKQKNNTKIKIQQEIQDFPERIRQSMLLTWYGSWKI